MSNEIIKESAIIYQVMIERIEQINNTQGIEAIKYLLAINTVLSRTQRVDIIEKIREKEIKIKDRESL